MKHQPLPLYILDANTYFYSSTKQKYSQEFAFCLQVSSGSSSFHPQSKDLKFWLTGDSKMPSKVHLSMNGRLSLCVSPVIDWRPVLVLPRLSPQCQLGSAAKLHDPRW